MTSGPSGPDKNMEEVSVMAEGASFHSSQPPRMYTPESNQAYVHFREFACGAGAATVNVAATFPINKVMFRQQVYGFRIAKAIESISSEGLRRLYRGAGPPLLSAITSKSLMFGMYKWYSDFFVDTLRLTKDPGKIQKLAAIAAGTTECILVPLERIQTLLQIPKYNHEFRDTRHAFVRVLRDGGLKECYRGVTAIALRNGPCNVVFFSLREPLRERFAIHHSKAETLTVDFITGGCLGACTSTLFYPVNVAKSYMQSKYRTRHVGFVEALQTVYKDRGSIRKFYRGVHVNFTRSLLSWGIINSSYEILKDVL